MWQLAGWLPGFLVINLKSYGRISMTFLRNLNIGQRNTLFDFCDFNSIIYTCICFVLFIILGNPLGRKDIRDITYFQSLFQPI